MPPKFLVLLGMTVGSVIGSSVVAFFGSDYLSIWSLLGSFIGGAIGIFVILKITSD